MDREEQKELAKFVTEYIQDEVCVVQTKFTVVKPRSLEVMIQEAVAEYFTNKDNKLKIVRVRSLVSRAREACTGIYRKDCELIISWLKDARDMDMNIEGKYTNRISDAIMLLKESKGYGDRLKPDQILCDIINEIDGR